MGEAKKMLLGAFGLMLTVALIFAGYSIFSRSMDVADNITEGQSKTSQLIDEYPITKFDGTDIDGSQAIYYTKDVVGTYKIPVTIKTVKTPGGFTVSDSSYYNSFRDINSSYYINPLSKYNVVVNRDENDVIVSVSITYVVP